MYSEPPCSLKLSLEATVLVALSAGGCPRRSRRGDHERLVDLVFRAGHTLPEAGAVGALENGAALKRFYEALAKVADIVVCGADAVDPVDRVLSRDPAAGPARSRVAVHPDEVEAVERHAWLPPSGDEPN